jgi:hypothetical protein
MEGFNDSHTFLMNSALDYERGNQYSVYGVIRGDSWTNDWIIPVEGRILTSGDNLKEVGPGEEDCGPIYSDAFFFLQKMTEPTIKRTGQYS